jgi:exosortase/archaeosortase family protein
MRHSGYALIFLLALFIVGVPNAIRINWSTVGPLYAKTAAFFVPHATPAGDHVLTPAADVIITSQCSGAENIQTFSMLFATVFLMNWKRMQSWKSVLLYLGSLVGLALVNLARILTIVFRARETHYGLTNTLALILLIILIWKVKWLRPDASVPAANPPATQAS